MLTVPVGSLKMGSGPKGISSAVSEGAKAEYIQAETPQHDVSVKQFAMSVTEVTRDQFDAFVRATGYQAGGPCWVYSKVEYKYVESNANDWRDPGFSQDGNHPVVCVNWNDAKAYVRWLSQKTGKNYRLPTEAEWEYAARAGTATPRYWGWDNSSACRNANVSDQTRASAHNLDTGPTSIFQCTDGYVYTAPVAQFQANAFGLNDMLGNVWEWTEDCYNTSYNGAPTNGSAWLTGDCSLRVARGGSWVNGPLGVRSADRSGDTATVRDSVLGFRVSRTN
jgi:formylglycine-generating enzyme required for sulfatase activity